MANLGDMVVRIVGDSTGLNKSLTDSQKKMAAFGVNAAAVVAVVTQITRAVVNATKEFVDYGSAINDASEKTGLSTDAIQEWKFIAEQTGTTLENVTGAVGMMTRGLTTNADSFAKLGIVLKNNDGTFRSTTEIFNDTIERLSAMTDETERDQMAFKLLGRSAQSLIPILNAGAGGIKDMRDKAHDLGLVLDNEAIKNADTLGDSTDALKAAFKAAAASMVNDMAPALIKVANGMTVLITKTISAKEEYKAYEAFTGGAALKTKELGDALKYVVQQQEDQKRLAAASGGRISADDGTMAKLKAEESALRAKLKLASEEEAWAKRVAEANAAAAKAAADAAEKALADGEKKKAAAADLAEATVEAGEVIITMESDIDAIRKKAYDDWAKANAQFIQDQLDDAAALAAANKAAAEKSAKAWNDAYKSVLSVAKPIFEEIGSSIADGSFQWENLATVAVNSIGNIVSALGDQLAAESAAALIKAIAALAGVVTAPLAPGYFAQSAILAGGAAAAWASAGAMKSAKFAEGGVVQPVAGGIQATVAEAGMAEAIIPLDRLDRMLQNAGSIGGGGDAMTRLIVNLDSKPLLDKIFSATKNRTVLIDAGAVV
jgi:hypothetical protein